MRQSRAADGEASGTLSTCAERVIVGIMRIKYCRAAGRDTGHRAGPAPWACRQTDGSTVQCACTLSGRAAHAPASVSMSTRKPCPVLLSFALSQRLATHWRFACSSATGTARAVSMFTGDWFSPAAAANERAHVCGPAAHIFVKVTHAAHCLQIDSQPPNTKHELANSKTLDRTRIFIHTEHTHRHTVPGVVSPAALLSV